MRSRARRLAVIAAAVLCAPAGARSETRVRLKPGVFLYAAPDLPDPNFAESVVLLVQHEDQGSMGLIMNRPSRIPLREALTELGELRGLDLPLYRGGPVQPETILALVRSSKRLEGALRVLPDVHLCGDLEQVKAAARQPEAASRLKVCAGYAGWSAGQLATEVRRGAWVIGPADAGSVFTSDPSVLWPRIHQLMQRIEVRSRPGAFHRVLSGRAPFACLPGRPPSGPMPAAQRP